MTVRILLVQKSITRGGKELVEKKYIFSEETQSRKTGLKMQKVKSQRFFFRDAGELDLPNNLEIISRMYNVHS